MYTEDIDELIIAVFDLLDEYCSLTVEQEEELIDLIENKLEPFNEGYRNYN